MDEYFAFRIFLIEASQGELFSNNISKKERMESLLTHIEENRKAEILDIGTRYLFYYLRKVSNQFYILQIAREETYTKPSEGERFIETIEDKRYPFIHIILDIERQIILIQHKTSVFKDINIPKTKLEKFITQNLSIYGLIAKIQEISSEITFWEQLKEYDEIYSFDITLNAPNLFGARYRANDLSKDIQENYNATEFRIKLKNALGKLKLLKENVSDYLKLASAGAGKYIAEVAKEGIKEKIGSFTYILKKHYDKNVNEITVNELNKDFEELDKYNDENS